MRNKHYRILTLSAMLLLGLTALSTMAADEPKTDASHTEACSCEGCSEPVGSALPPHDDCEDHDTHTEQDDSHADCTHDHEDDDDHASHVPAKEDDAHADESTIHLDSEAEKLIDIQTVAAQAGTIASTIRLTGQIRLNEDTLAHIVPLTSGIVRKVNNNIGDTVKKDDILAWIESAELGQSKVKYLDIQAELGCCATLLTRAQTIHDNTLKMIELLKTNPGLDDLGKIEGLEMGANRSDLVNVYAEYVFAKSVYEREKPLYEQKISSKQEYLNAENHLKKARADYLAMLDTIQFRVQQDLLEATSDQQRMEIALKGAERTLYVFGQTTNDIQRLNILAQSPTVHAGGGDCSDPDCEACRKKAEQATGAKPASADFQRLGWYPLRAPFDGTVIEKHVTIGERLSEDTSAFTVADLNSVWIDMSVFSKDLPFLKKGQPCQIAMETQTFKGRFSFLSPVLDPKTRTATARIVADNTEGHLKPGLFVSATVFGKADAGKLVVPAAAVQTVNGETCIFVQNGDEYALRHVTAGRSDTTHVEIVSGLHQGEHVVTQGAFDLKAKMVTGTLDSHAGHGH
ncbi:MAG: efflux RND transporter periplasmic adaptor subunit [Planctomycetota bacterium]